MSTESQSARDSSMVRFLKRRWLAIILVVVVIIIAIQNGVSSESSTIWLLWAKVAMPTWVLVVITFLVGAIVGWVLARNRAARKARR